MRQFIPFLLFLFVVSHASATAEPACFPSCLPWSGLSIGWGKLKRCVEADQLLLTLIIFLIGNACASAAAQIEATAGQQLKTVYDGKVRPDYGRLHLTSQCALTRA